MRFVFPLLGLIMFAAPLRAQDDEFDPKYRMNGELLPKLFPEALAKVAQSVVEILDENDETVALGTVVSASGHILTKASDLPEALRVRLPSSEIRPLKDIKIDRKNDLALLQIEPTTELQPVAWESPSEDLALGTWLVAPTVGRKLQIGIVSAKQRSLERVAGVIGVELGDASEQGVLVTGVSPSGGAADAGIEPGDYISYVEDQPIASVEDISNLIKQREPGEKVWVVIIREDTGMELEVMIGHRSIVFDMFSRNQMMSGSTSRRRSGYTNAIQHEMWMEAASMGGPLMDLNGRVIGLNIAKANRVEIFAIPAAQIKAKIESWLSAE